MENSQGLKVKLYNIKFVFYKVRSTKLEKRFLYLDIVVIEIYLQTLKPSGDIHLISKFHYFYYHKIITENVKILIQDKLITD